MSEQRQTEILVERGELRFPEDVPLMIEHLKKGWTIGGGDAVLILKGLLQMSMSDARMFAELSARVAELENKMCVVIAQIALAQADIHDHVEGKNVHNEVLGPVADHSDLIEDRAARDGLRTLLERGGVTVAEDSKAPSSDSPIETPGVDYPKFEDKPELRDKLAALQGGESVASTAAPSKPGSTRK